MIAISIIIPIYNGESCIEKSLDSVIGQTLKNIEIICIDDGSTDGTMDYLETYAKKDERIKIICQSNKGAGYARNRGLQEAVGEYIAFLDADDYYLDANALEKMYQACVEHGVQISGSLRKNIKNHQLEEALLFEDSDISVAPNRIYNYRDIQCDYNYQSFIFKKELLIANGIQFPLHRRFQDPPFFVKAMYASEQFYLTDAYLYCYLVPNVSQRFSIDKTVDLLKGLKENIAFAIEHDLQILFENTLQRLEYEYASVIYRHIAKDDIRIVQMLLELNSIVSQHLNDTTYIIRPLKRLLEVAWENNQNYENVLQSKIANVSTISIYGAGNLAKCFFCYLKEKGISDKVDKFMVSSMTDNEAYLYDVPVIVLSDYNVVENEKIFVAVGIKSQKEIVAMLEEKGITNYEILDWEFLKILEEKG